MLLRKNIFVFRLRIMSREIIFCKKFEIFFEIFLPELNFVAKNSFSADNISRYKNSMRLMIGVVLWRNRKRLRMWWSPRK